LDFHLDFHLDLQLDIYFQAGGLGALTDSPISGTIFFNWLSDLPAGQRALASSVEDADSLDSLDWNFEGNVPNFATAARAQPGPKSGYVLCFD